MNPILPPASTNHLGQPRRLGVELEFAGLAPAAILDTLTAVFGGTVHRETRFEYRIRDSTIGEVRLELDATYLKDLAREAQEDTRRTGLGRITDDMLASAAQLVVPWELVTEPLAMTRLPDLEPLVAALRDAGARGTRHSPWYAFGLHFNPEMPEVDAATILSYIRSYTCLYDWLVDREQLDPSRKWFTPYIETFDAEYQDLVLDQDYAPDPYALMDDYLAANPTRNRSLDMLPLFAWLDEDRVQQTVDDPRVKPRPALHYRLPNCDIDHPDWKLGEPWSRWVQVENLAGSPERLQRACRAFRRERERGTRIFKSRWIEQCESWLVRGT